jgi:predicted transcriptional regulator
VVNQIGRRSEAEIVADILAVIFDGARKTRIMYGANLSYALTRRYLNKLLECKLIQYDEEAKKYLLTRTGRRYLDEYAVYKNIEENLISQTSLFEEKRGILMQMLVNSEPRE